MGDFCLSIFRLSNRRGFFVPKLDLGYAEKDTDIAWHINGGGARVYLARTGSKLVDDLDEQSADSHFMMKRIVCSLLLARVGLFQPEACGRFFMRNIEGDLSWTTELDWPDPVPDTGDPAAIARFHDWFTALTMHTALRRAAEDTHLALTHPHEALVYVYRGFEWLVVGLGIGWDDLSTMIDVPPAELRNLKKQANVDTGVRHANRDGMKVRADIYVSGTWVCCLIDAINGVRGNLEQGFTKMNSKEVAEAVGRSVTSTPYE